MTATTTQGPRPIAGAVELLSGLRALVRRFSISERAEVVCCGMTIAQAATLEVLRREGHLRQGELGRRLGITASTLSRNLDRLLEAGWVERETDPRDGRAATIGLTAAGTTAADRAERQEEEFAGLILSRIPEGERPAVLRGLRTLLEGVRSATEECCPGAFDHLMQDLAPSGADSSCVAREEKGKR